MCSNELITYDFCFSTFGHVRICSEKLKEEKHVYGHNTLMFIFRSSETKQTVLYVTHGMAENAHVPPWQHTAPLHKCRVMDL